MESFRARRGTETAGSGGKIVRGRRRLPVRSPYSRPERRTREEEEEEEEEENPNWLVGLVSPAAKVITGAGKFISNVFFPDSTSSSSSASAEDDESDDDDISSEDVDKSDENIATPEASKHSQNDLQLRVRKSEAKLVIEKLLKEEYFSRDECDRLVEIIQSRTVEFPATKEGEDSYKGNGFDTFSPRVTSLGGHTSDFRNTAIMEAKKWLEENKLECERTLNSTLPNVAEGEHGSPVIVAKSYMKARPPWASPTIGHTGYQTSSPGMHLFKDTPSSFGADFLSSSKLAKRSNLTFDSSDTLDGTRRVRFKSAGDVLQPFSSSSLELDYGGGKTSLEAEKGGVQLGSVARDSNSSPLLGSVNAATPLTTLAGLEDARVANGEGCSTREHRYSSSEQHDGAVNQPSEIVNAEPKVMPSEGIKHAFESDTNGLAGVSDVPEFGKQPEEVQVKNSSQEHQCYDLKETNSSNGSKAFHEAPSTQKEVNGSREAVAANGFPTSSSLSAESRQTPENKANPKPTSSNDGKTTTGIPLEESCELLSEASVEVPINDDVDGIASGSENNSSKHSEELLHSKPEPDFSPGPRFSTRIKKQVAKKVGRYSKRGRGRG